MAMLSPSPMLSLSPCSLPRACSLSTHPLSPPMLRHLVLPLPPSNFVFLRILPVPFLRWLSLLTLPSPLGLQAERSAKEEIGDFVAERSGLSKRQTPEWQHADTTREASAAAMSDKRERTCDSTILSGCVRALCVPLQRIQCYFTVDHSLDFKGDHARHFATTQRVTCFSSWPNRVMLQRLTCDLTAVRVCLTALAAAPRKRVMDVLINAKRRATTLLVSGCASTT